MPLITGSAISERLFGTSSNDTLQGRAGNDTLKGGLGADVLDGGLGFDVASYAQDPIGRTGAFVNERNGTHNGAAAGDTLISIEGFVGTTLGDSFVLGDADNRAIGLGGNDFIDGGLGNDTLVGGEGSDFLHGGLGDDTAGYFFSNAAVAINLQTGATSGGHATGDTLSWVEHINGSQFGDTLHGDILNNRLRGIDGNDTLSGAEGADTLIGGRGSDQLTGGDDADSFRFVQLHHHVSTTGADTSRLDSFVSADADAITDFSSGTDLLSFRASQFSGNVFNTNSIADLGLTTANDSAFGYTGGNLFYVYFATSSDFDSATVSVAHLAALTGINTLSASDFEFL